uniref:Protamine n=1 Tax=Drosophila melanogaster TaxID=7227 RepID=A0A0S0X2Z1_DROME|nr:uncharacterized protein Dmel_CG46192 [Drosophila melanogaster]ALI51679.1 uncharacterized protein Dmel_CG46192 [Drosophila melanogaster]|eukprot:NP_001303591.1 uncharacterized protein Dmel_CG46192 [Drosophila melanogaster]
MLTSCTSNKYHIKLPFPFLFRIVENILYFSPMTRSLRRACAKPKVCAKQKAEKACDKVKCTKLGPITSNCYFNFVRSYRIKHCDVNPQGLISKAAKAWRMLKTRFSQIEKNAIRIWNKHSELRSDLLEEEEHE